MRDLALIMNPDGTPATVKLAMRESTTAPGRIKAAFAVEIQEGSTIRMEDGTRQKVGEKMLDASEGGVATAFVAPEFRIEVTG